MQPRLRSYRAHVKRGGIATGQTMLFGATPAHLYRRPCAKSRTSNQESAPWQNRQFGIPSNSANCACVSRCLLRMSWAIWNSCGWLQTISQIPCWAARTTSKSPPSGMANQEFSQMPSSNWNGWMQHRTGNYVSIIIGNTARNTSWTACGCRRSGVASQPRLLQRTMCRRRFATSRSQPSPTQRNPTRPNPTKLNPTKHNRAQPCQSNPNHSQPKGHARAATSLNRSTRSRHRRLAIRRSYSIGDGKCLCRITSQRQSRSRGRRAESRGGVTRLENCTTTPLRMPIARRGPICWMHFKNSRTESTKRFAYVRDLASCKTRVDS